MAKVNVPVPRDEPLVRLDQLADQLDERITIEGGQGDSGRRLVQALHILVWPEEAYLSLRVLVCLHALKASKCVVEDACCGIEREVLVRCYAWVQPTF